MSIFESLHPRLIEMLNKVGITRPTAAQEKSIGYILGGDHTLLIAPTGIGKTEAAAIPVFDSLLRAGPGKPGRRGFRVIYVTPLRALNRDIVARLEKWGEYLGIPVGLRHGDTSRYERTKQSRNPPDFLITTPETLQILFTGRRLLKHLEAVRYVIVDEVHELCSNMRGAQLSVVLERLELISAQTPVRVGLSATVGVDSIVETANFLGGMARRVKVVRIDSKKRMSVSVITPRAYDDGGKLEAELACTGDELASILLSRQLIEKLHPVLFFVNTRQTAEVLASRLTLFDPELPVGIHHGSLSKEVRTSMEDDFKAGRLKGLICTSSLELGIDVGFVDNVIQFSSPREVSRLVQRMGRSGHRVGRISKGTIIASRPDDIMESGVVARRALAGELESIRVVREPLAVLSNQIMAWCMEGSGGENGLIDRDMLKTIRRAYPFSTLGKDVFFRLLEELAEMRLIWWDRESGKVTRRKQTRDYFYDNISMIRDEKVYKVTDIATRRPVGTLDEEFVSVYLEPSTKFIVRGRAWVVVEIQKDSILAAPGDDIGAIPSWVGEEIPVPFEVAQEVGRARAMICTMLLEDNGDREHVVDELRERYYLGGEAARKYVDYIDGQMKGHTVPLHDRILLERQGRAVVLNTCFGTRTNETLALLLSSLIAGRLGTGIETSTEAYRIVLDVPHSFGMNDIANTLSYIVPEDVEKLLSVVLRNSPLARWHFIYTAKKFGAIRKEAELGKVNMGYLMSSYGDTLIFEETIRRLLADRLDPKNTAGILHGLRAGTIELVTAEGLSPISMEGLSDRSTLISPYKADSSVLKALKARLLKQRVVLVCMNCHSFSHKIIRDIPVRKRAVCWNCGGTYLAALRDYELDTLEFLKCSGSSRERTAGERKRMDRLMANASLIAKHGRKGAMTLMGRGIGPRRAARILPQPFEFEEDLLREILRAEIEYARTRQFWD